MPGQRGRPGVHLVEQGGPRPRGRAGQDLHHCHQVIMFFVEVLGAKATSTNYSLGPRGDWHSAKQTADRTSLFGALVYISFRLFSNSQMLYCFLTYFLTLESWSMLAPSSRSSLRGRRTAGATSARPPTPSASRSTTSNCKSGVSSEKM